MARPQSSQSAGFCGNWAVVTAFEIETFPALLILQIEHTFGLYSFMAVFGTGIPGVPERRCRYEIAHSG